MDPLFNTLSDARRAGTELSGSADAGRAIEITRRRQPRIGDAEFEGLRDESPGRKVAL